ncbi:hypothetical protein RchiOBHm_Chr4g0391671 [Rosa chinensis]|uniref:Uncharacterized protein n=1 Tax=Rosa chinensis TaxID=74649 RepID=A0A2P6QQI9_ROSCH|nr:hypothetical protein RchiOBHm_Chr4g0391671 [Rosa chinensis]
MNSLLMFGVEIDSPLYVLFFHTSCNLFRCEIHFQLYFADIHSPALNTQNTKRLYMENLQQ